MKQENSRSSKNLTALYQMSLALAAPAELVCCANSNSPRLLLQMPFYVKFSPIFGKSRSAQIRTLLLLCFGLVL